MPSNITKNRAKRIKQGDKFCLCCGSKDNLSIDHIIPRSLGGVNRNENYQTLCRFCNNLKGKKIINFRNSRNSRMYVIYWVKNNLKYKNQRYYNKLNIRAIDRNKDAFIAKERHLGVVRVDSNNSKITINPCTGRVTLKVSYLCPSKVVDKMTELTNKIMKDFLLSPVTHRGRISFKNSKYYVVMMSESQRFKYYYEVEA